jgi:hypothetical protein
MLSSEVTLTTGDLIRGVLLLASIALNLFQFYRQRIAGQTIYNSIVGLFNSIGWLLAREIGKVRNLDGRISGAWAVESKTVLQEFRDYAEESNFKLRILHEQLVAIAKMVRKKDKRWEGDKFGMSDEALQELERRARGGA